MLGVQGGTLLERQSERNALRSMCRAVGDGVGALVLVDGPAGIGKTALLAAAARDAREAGLVVLPARAGQREATFPFGVVRQLLEPALARLDETARAARFKGAAGLAAPLFDDVDHAAALQVDADFTVLHGLFWLAANLAAQAPLLLIVDDVQWADPPSLRWLEYLARRFDGLPLGLILGRRPGEVAAADETVADLARLDQAVVLRPAPLSADATTEIVQSAFGGTADPAFCAACHAATGGNPLLVRQFSAELARTGVLPADYAVERVGELMSSAIAELVAGRLRGAGEQAIALIQAVAVLGERAAPALAIELAGIAADEAVPVLERLRALDLLGPGPALEFAHPLIRTALEAQVGMTALAEVHARAARLLDRHGAPADAVAPHLLDVPPAGDPWAAAVLEAGAHAAAARGASSSARALLERALAEPPQTGEDTARMQLRLGELLVLAADMLGAIPVLESVLDVATDPLLRAQAVQELAVPLLAVQRTRESVERLDAVQAELQEHDPVLSTTLEAAALAFTRWDLELGDEFVARLARARRLARPDDSVGRLVLFLAGLHDIISGLPGGVGVAEVREALSGGLLRDVGAHGPPYALACLMLVMGGDLEGAELHLAAGEDEVRRTGSALGRSILCNARARLLLARGALADAEAVAALGLEVTAVSIGMPTLLGSLVEGLVLRGDLDRAAEALERGGGAGPLPPLITCYLLVEARARLNAARDRHLEALEDCALLADWLRMAHAAGPMPVFWQPIAVASHLALGQRGEARRVAEEAVALASAFGEPRSLAVALTAQATVSDAPDALALLGTAAERAEQAGARLVLAEVETARGELLARAGDTEAAREALRSGYARATACGAAPLASRAHDALVATGARPRRASTAGPAALTATELRVARLAGEGLSNREVAEQLYVTVKTVEMHLSSAYRKLGIASRAQLAATLPTV